MNNRHAKLRLVRNRKNNNKTPKQTVDSEYIKELKSGINERDIKISELEEYNVNANDLLKRTTNDLCLVRSELIRVKFDKQELEEYNDKYAFDVYHAKSIIGKIILLVNLLFKSKKGHIKS